MEMKTSTILGNECTGIDTHIQINMKVSLDERTLSIIVVPTSRQQMLPSVIKCNKIIKNMCDCLAL